MFKCQDCGVPAHKLFRRVTQIRPVHYLHLLVPPHPKKGKTIESQGWETVEELQLCQACDSLLQSQPVQQRGPLKRVVCQQR